MKLFERQDVEMKKIVLNWIKAYESRDLALMSELFLDTTKSFHYGTGEDERIEGIGGMKAQLQRDWSQSEDTVLELVEMRSEVFEDKFGWISCEIIPKIRVGGEVCEFQRLRCTMAVVLDDGGWKIAHSHASWPHVYQEVGKSFPDRHPI